MARFLSIFLLTCAAYAAQVRILSYNIKHCQGMDGKVDVARIAAVIRSVEPDIVALQEVDQIVPRSGGVPQAEELGRLTGLKAIFGRTIDLDGGQYGNAVLTALPVVRWTNHPLPGSEPRGVIEVQFEQFQFFATHLDAGRDERPRVESVAAIERPVKGPALMAGDLNSVPGSDPIRALSAAGWSIAGEDRNLLTIPSRAPARQLDFILFRPANAFRVIQIRVLDEPVASDHRPVFAVLEFL
ncbi:MAG: endonuclease/exonuclease/phosphatase family protein [Bryobacterales bacterium]|nr:endonuclease/exonuclease/phosphatase family protein [Bryobacterales bacterium]